MKIDEPALKLSTDMYGHPRLSVSAGGFVMILPSSDSTEPEEVFGAKLRPHRTIKNPFLPMEFRSRDVGIGCSPVFFGPSQPKKHRDPKSHHLPKRAHMTQLGANSKFFSEC